MGGLTAQMHGQCTGAEGQMGRPFIGHLPVPESGLHSGLFGTQACGPECACQSGQHIASAAACQQGVTTALIQGVLFGLEMIVPEPLSSAVH